MSILPPPPPPPPTAMAEGVSQTSRMHLYPLLTRQRGSLLVTMPLRAEFFQKGKRDHVRMEYIGSLIKVLDPIPHLKSEFPFKKTYDYH